MRISWGVLAGLCASGASAQLPDASASGTDARGEVVVTAARTVLPASALPLTVDVIDRETLSRQVAVSGSVVDAVSALLPAFSPTRENITGVGETLRGLKTTAEELPGYVERLAQRYLAGRHGDETFANWVIRVDEDELR